VGTTPIPAALWDDLRAARLLRADAPAGEASGTALRLFASARATSEVGCDDVVTAGEFAAGSG
jgi:hypothetical protein